MITKKIKLICIITFSIVSVLVADNNMFITKPINAVVDHKDVEVSGGSRISSPVHNTLFIVDKTGHKYKVPDYIFSMHHIGDSFSIIRSFLFRKAIRFQTTKDGIGITENIGVINSDWFSKTLSIIPLFLCIIVIFFDKLLKSETQQAGAVCISILLAAVIIAFYFIFST
jgi:hypothetical protein